MHNCLCLFDYFRAGNKSAESGSAFQVLPPCTCVTLTTAASIRQLTTVCNWVIKCVAATSTSLPKCGIAHSSRPFNPITCREQVARGSGQIRSAPAQHHIARPIIFPDQQQDLFICGNLFNGLFELNGRVDRFAVNFQNHRASANTRHGSN